MTGGVGLQLGPTVNLLQDEQPGSLFLLSAIVLCGLQFNVASAFGQDPGRGSWMISARTAQGLSGARETGAQPESGSDRWLADVSEIGWQYLVIHHSGTAAGSVASIHADHRRRVDAAGNPWLGIGYHFVIGNGRSGGRAPFMQIGHDRSGVGVLPHFLARDGVQTVKRLFPVAMAQCV